jgi:hypothetical protein
MPLCLLVKTVLTISSVFDELPLHPLYRALYEPALAAERLFAADALLERLS